MWLFIEPLDVWLFRDGRPFDAGADHRARSLFPPNPTTIQGVIRSQVLCFYDVDLKAFKRGEVAKEVSEQIGLPSGKGRPGTLGSLRIEGPFVARREKEGIMPYFARPGDIAQVKRENPSDLTIKLVQLEVESSSQNVVANWPQDGLRPLVYRGDKKVESKPLWVSGAALGRYLTDREEAVSGWQEGTDFLQTEALFSREGRFGVGIDSRVKRPVEGFLYQIEYVRPRPDVGLLVNVSGLDESKWPEQGLLSIGGEARAGRFMKVPKPSVWPSNRPGGGKTKVYVATPAYFSAGWAPAGWDGYFNSAPGYLRAASVGRYQSVGGWDVAHNRPKPMRRYVPAGSLYYFDEPVGDEKKRLCDDPFDAKIGFGHYFIGRW